MQMPVECFFAMTRPRTCPLIRSFSGCGEVLLLRLLFQAEVVGGSAEKIFAFHAGARVTRPDRAAGQLQRARFCFPFVKLMVISNSATALISLSAPARKINQSPARPYLMQGCVEGMVVFVHGVVVRSVVRDEKCPSSPVAVVVVTSVQNVAVEK